MKSQLEAKSSPPPCPRVCSRCWEVRTSVRRRLVSDVLHTIERFWCDACAKDCRRIEPLRIVEDADLEGVLRPVDDAA